MALITIPKPSPKAEYPSGWTPQKPEAFNHPYFIKRTKSHMMPVYLKLGFRNFKKTTIIRNIKGDIWKCHEEILDYITHYMAQKHRSKVNEFSGIITVHGDHVNLIKDYLISKGF